MQYFPILWKHAILFPLLKPKLSGSDPSHYRMIALLNHSAKILVTLLANKLRNFVNEMSIIPNEQAGFQPHLGVDH